MSPLTNQSDADRRGITPRIWVCALGVLLAIGVAGCNRTQKSREIPEAIKGTTLVVEAEGALAGGDEVAALNLLAQAIEVNPTLTVAHLRMAEIHRNRGDLQDSERGYRRAVTLEPRSFVAQLGHAEVLHALGRVIEAVRAYVRAVSLEPENPSANKGLAAAYLELKEPRAALQYAQRATALDPTDGRSHANLGAIYSLLDRHEDAVTEYEAAAELMDLNAELLLNWANSLGAIDRYDEMINTLNEVLKLEPSAVAHERLGYARFKQRRYAEASQHFRDAIEIDDRHYPALNGLAVVLLNDYVRSERRDDALRIEALNMLRKSLQINSDQPKFVDLVSRFRRG
jgi:tetratricopeptide (TPR) repeat protein